MLRQLHSLPGLIAALLVMILALSGAMLSVDPALERLHQAPVASGQLNVGQLAGRVATSPAWSRFNAARPGP
jgi:sulfite reductase (NADPH) flavoprotein alpha-component